MMRNLLFMAVVIVSAAACRKYEEPTARADQSESLILLLDGFTGLYNVHATRVERDTIAGTAVQTDTDTIVVLSRADVNVMEFLVYRPVFDIANKTDDIYNETDNYTLLGENNTTDVYQTLTLYNKASPKRLQFVQYDKTTTGDITITYTGYLQ